MNRDNIQGSWKQFTGEVKNQWGKLIGRQLEMIDGKLVEVSGNIQHGYGITRDATEQQIKHFKERNED